jgi:hypothetical protein
MRAELAELWLGKAADVITSRSFDATPVFSVLDPAALAYLSNARRCTYR